MSLEAKIDALTSAVLGLTYALNQHPATSTSSVVVRAPKSFTAEIEKEIGKTIDALDKKDATVHEAIIKEKTEIAESKKSKTTTDTSPHSEPESKAVSYDDVKKATNALSAAKGRDATIAVLSRFGVKKATELDEAQWVDYVEHAGNVAEGADV